jgi:hypothetical protein
MPTVNPRVRSVLLCLLVLLTTSVHAQRTTGDLLGVVKDSSGAILPGVTVSVTGPNIPRAQTTVTSENGSYRVTNLPPGTYTVTFELSGFKTVSMQGLRVSVGSALEQNIGLEIGALAESVNVTAETPVVDTTSNEVGTTFDKECAVTPLRLLRSAGASAGIGEGRRRRRGRRAADHELRRLVRRERVSARRRQRHRQLLQRGILGAESRRDRRSRSAVARRAG